MTAPLVASKLVRRFAVAVVIAGVLGGAGAALAMRPVDVRTEHAETGAVVVERREAATRIRRGVCDVARGRCMVDRGGRVASVDARFGLVGNDWIEVTSGLTASDVLLASLDARRELPVGRRHR